MRIHAYLAHRQSGFYPLARIIEAAEKTNFSHVALGFEESGSVTIYEALLPVGTHKVGFGDWVTQNNFSVAREYIWEVPDDLGTECRNIAEQMLGSGYSYLQLVLSYVVQFAGFVRRLVSKKKENGYICTEYCYDVLKPLMDRANMKLAVDPDLLSLNQIKMIFDQIPASLPGVTGSSTTKLAAASRPVSGIGVRRGR